MSTKSCRFCAEEIKADAIKCRFCGESLLVTAEPAFQSVPAINGAPKQRIGLRAFGVALLLGGAGMVGYFLYGFDTTVPMSSVEWLGQQFGGMPVHNIGLLQHQQNGILIGSMVVLSGFVSLLESLRR